MKQFDRFLSSFGSISAFPEDISCASALITTGFKPDGPGAFRFLIRLMESLTSLIVGGSFSDGISSFWGSRVSSDSLHSMFWLLKILLKCS